MKRAKQDLSKEIYHIHGLEDNIVKCHFPQNCFVHLDKLIPNVQRKGEGKGTRRATTVLRKKNTTGGC